jgi:HK97 family phage prohead protease
MTDSTLLPLELRQTAENVLEGICVPYGETTLKAGYPQGERFVRGAFASTANGKSKVRLTDVHDEKKRPVGIATAFRDAEDGLYGTFRFYNTPEGRGARENVLEETYGGLSVGFLTDAERRAEDGAREVLKARLFHVSLVDEPAYDSAQILAVRAAASPEVDALLAVEYDLSEFPEAVDLAALVWPGR